MVRYFLISYIFFVAVSCEFRKQQNNILPEVINPRFTEFPLKSSNRALEVVDENTVWFAGSNGMFGYTTDSGEHWEIDSIQINGNPLEFRAISVTDNAVFLLNVASPAYLLKSVDDGESWDIVYHEDHEKVFYNSMKFWDDQNGIAVGDPIDGCLSVIITKNGGDTWKKLDCSLLPETVEGEAGFAASNTNIALKGSNVWLATGGKKARIFHSSNKGESWDVFNTPIQQGGKMTGIFSVDFFNESEGMIFGGNWENQSDNTKNKSITSDGGKTWQLVADGANPGYRSCVQYIPNTAGNGIISVGIPGISYSDDGGHHWQEIEKSYFYTIRFTPQGSVAWLAGRNKIARMEW